MRILGPRFFSSKHQKPRNFRFELPDVEFQAAISVIQEAEAADPGSRLGAMTLGGYSTGKTLCLNERLRTFNRLARDTLSEYLESEVEFMGGWGNILRKGQRVDRHNHYQADGSMIFFLSDHASENTGRLKFELRNLTFNPERGLAVCMTGEEVHYVEPVGYDRDRYSLIYNVRRRN